MVVRCYRTTVYSYDDCKLFMQQHVHVVERAFIVGRVLVDTQLLYAVTCPCLPN